MQATQNQRQKQNLFPQNNLLSNYINENIERVHSQVFLDEEHLNELYIEYKDEIDQQLAEAEQNLVFLLERSLIDDLWDRASNKMDLKNRFLNMIESGVAKSYKATVRAFQPYYRNLRAKLSKSEDVKNAARLLEAGREHYRNVLVNIKKCTQLNHRILLLLRDINEQRDDDNKLSFQQLHKNPQKFAKYIDKLISNTKSPQMTDDLRSLKSSAEERAAVLRAVLISYKFLQDRTARPYGIDLAPMATTIAELQSMGEKIENPNKDQGDSDKNKTKGSKDERKGVGNFYNDINGIPSQYSDDAVKEIHQWIQTQLDDKGNRKYDQALIRKWQTEYQSRLAAKRQNNSVDVDVKSFENLLLEFINEDTTTDDRVAKQLRDLNNAGLKLLKKIKIKEIVKTIEALQKHEQEHSTQLGNKSGVSNLIRNIQTIHKNIVHDYEQAVNRSQSSINIPGIARLSWSKEKVPVYHVVVSSEILLAYYHFTQNISDLLGNLLKNPTEESVKYMQDSEFIAGRRTPISKILSHLNQHYYNELIHLSSGVHNLSQIHHLAIKLMDFNEERIFHNINHENHTFKDDSTDFGNLVKFLIKHKDIFVNKSNNVDMRKAVQKNHEVKNELESLLASNSLKQIGQMDNEGGLNKKAFEKLKQALKDDHKESFYHDHELHDKEEMKEGWEKLFLKNPKDYSPFIAGAVIQRAKYYEALLIDLNKSIADEIPKYIEDFDGKKDVDENDIKRIANDIKVDIDRNTEEPELIVWRTNQEINKKFITNDGIIKHDDLAQQLSQGGLHQQLKNIGIGFHGFYQELSDFSKHFHQDAFVGSEEEKIEKLKKTFKILLENKFRIEHEIFEILGEYADEIKKFTTDKSDNRSIKIKHITDHERETIKSVIQYTLDKRELNSLKNDENFTLSTQDKTTAYTPTGWEGKDKKHFFVGLGSITSHINVLEKIDRFSKVSFEIFKKFGILDGKGKEENNSNENNSNENKRKIGFRVNEETEEKKSSENTFNSHSLLSLYSDDKKFTNNMKMRINEIQRLKKAFDEHQKIQKEYVKPNLLFFIQRLKHIIEMWSKNKNDPNKRYNKKLSNSFKRVKESHLKQDLYHDKAQPDVMKAKREATLKAEDDKDQWIDRFSERDVFVALIQEFEQNPKRINEFVSKYLTDFSKRKIEDVKNVKVDDIPAKLKKEYIIHFLENLFPHNSYHHLAVRARSSKDEDLHTFSKNLEEYKLSNKIHLTYSDLKKMSVEPEDLDDKDSKDEDEDDSHIIDFYRSKAEKQENERLDMLLDISHSMSAHGEEEAKKKEDEYEDEEDDEPEYKKKEERDVDSLFNTSFDELTKKGHAYAERYGKEVWNSVGKTMEQSTIFKQLANKDQKVVAHQVLLDLHHTLGSVGKMNGIQQTKFSKLFMLNNQTFFQTKTRGYSSKEKLENNENDIWKSLEDVNPNTAYNQLPDQLRDRISKETYMQTYKIVNRSSSSKSMSKNQRKSYAHLLTALGSDLEHSTDQKFSPQQRNEIMFKFGRRVSKYVQHMLREQNEIPENAEVLTERVASIRWRRNPRTHLNKVVMTCKQGEYKKSLNKQLKIAGQSVKEVMCLPKNSKPAIDKAKDRKSAIKRWRKIKSNPGKMSRSNLKRKFTKKFSKTLR